MKTKERPIGIFDSGIGGLTVLKEIVRSFPHEDIVYFGDTARVPYGNKSAQTIVKFSSENVKFLLKFGVKLIIVACNTSSSLALATLRRRFNVPFLGVISPAVKQAVQISSTGRIGIIGTRATVSSSCYQKEIKRLQKGYKSFVRACPLFVPLAEEGWIDEGITFKVAEKYLRPLLKKEIDTLILGCTHYPLLKGVIRKVAGSRIQFIDSAEEVAKDTKMLFTANDLFAANRTRAGECKFFVSDEPAVFKKVGRRFLGKNIGAVRCI